MDKAKLKELGFTDEQIEKIVNLHNTTVENGYVKKSDHDMVSKELETTKSGIKTRDVQISELKKFEGTNSELTKKIKELELANEEADKKSKSELVLERKKNALKLKLLEETEQPHKVDMVADMFNLDGITTDEKGTIISGYAEQHANIKKDNAFLFKAATQNPPPNGFKPVGTTPQDGSDNTPKPDESVAFGKSLAEEKLKMLGVKPVGDTNLAK